MTDNLGGGRDFRSVSLLTPFTSLANRNRRELNLKVLDERVTFRDSFSDMLRTVSANHTFDECKAFLQKSKVRPTHTLSWLITR